MISNRKKIKKYPDRKFKKLIIMLLDRMINKSIVQILKEYPLISKSLFRLFKIHKLIITKNSIVQIVHHKVHVQEIKEHHLPLI